MNTNATKPRDRVDAATHSARPPSLYGATVEYGIHCMMYLIQPRATPVSSRDLAELQGVPVTLMARIMPRLEKAGIVVSTSGINGGYRLAKEPRKITVLDIVDAIDGRKNLFDCKDVRENCLLFGGAPPAWIFVQAADLYGSVQVGHFPHCAGRTLPSGGDYRRCYSRSHSS